MFFEVGKVTEEVGSYLEKAQGTIEHLKDTNLHETSTSKLESDASVDPDGSKENYKKYIDRANSELAESGKNISIPYARDQFMAEAKHRTEMAKLKIGSIFRDKQLKDMDNQVKIAISNGEHKYSTATTSNGLEQPVLEMNVLFDNMVSSGLMSKNEADLNKIEMMKKWDAANVKYNAQNRPQWYLDEVEKGDKGFFKGMPKEQLSQGKEWARTELNKIEAHNKAKARINLASTEHDLFMKAHNGALTNTELDNALANGQLNKPDGAIDMSFYKDMNKMINSPYLTADHKSSGYKDVLRAMEKSDPKKVSLDEIKRKILQHEADGTLSVDDAKDLANITAIPIMAGDKVTGLKSLNEIIAMEDAHKKAWADKVTMIKNAWNMFVGYAGAVVEDSAIGLMQKFTKAFNKGNITPEQAPQVANDLIKKQRVEDNPKIATLPKGGKKHTDAYGNVATIYPDGELKEEEQSNEEEPEERDTAN